MRKISLALAFIAGLLAAPANAANFSAKDAGAATIIFTNPGNCTTGCTPIFAWTDSTGANVVAVITAGADAASNTATGGITYARNMVFNGTTWDRWQGAVTVAGVATAANQTTINTSIGTTNTNLGAQADAAAAADNSTASLIALLKRTNQNLTTVNTTASAATPACAAAPCVTTIGNVGADPSSGKGTPSSAAIALAPLATPVNSAFSTLSTGGSLAQSTTYFYRVTAVNATGETLASTETSQVVGASGTATNTVTVNWGAVAGATSYKVYGRTTGAETLITASVGTVGTTYTDTGSALSGALPAANTTAGTTQIVALNGATLIYVTSFDVMSSGTTNVSFVYGTGTNCGAGQTVLTGIYPLTAQAGIAKGAGVGTILKVPSGQALCVTNSGNLQIGGSVSYQQF